MNIYNSQACNQTCYKKKLPATWNLKENAGGLPRQQNS